MSRAGSTGRPEAGQKPPIARIAVIGLLAAGVVVALYVAGRVHTVIPAFSLFGRRYLAAVSLKAVLATAALGVAVVQVLLALWMYRKLPWRAAPAGRPARAPGAGLRPVRADDTDRAALLPRWVLPVAGGMLAVAVAVLWYSSALWYYNGYQLPHL